MATAQDRISSKGARKKAPVVARARDDGRMPSDLTIPQVLHCAGSVTAERILTRSIEFARVLQPMHIHVVGASSLFRAAIAVGCEEPGKETTSANWLADWLARSGPTDRVKKWLDKTRPGGTVSRDAPLTNSAVATLGRAVTLAQRTVERGEFDARHLIAALLLPTKGQMSASVKEDVAEFEANPADFLKLLVSHIRSSPAPAEKTRLNVWDEVAKLQSDIAPAKIPSRQRAFLTDYASDIAAGTDQLGIYPDVRSIAELISLRDAQPPLSVGLFGNWGSGKSFFMHMLQQEVDKVTEDARKQTRRSNGKSASPFVDNIVQIQFNAWHYSDANLWASLTAEFFDQLRVGGFSGSGEATHAALIKQVSKHIQSLESDAARINQHAENLESKAKSMAAAVARNEQALARTELEILTSQIGKQIEKLTKENKDQINEIGQRLFRDDNFADSAHFTTVLSELRTTPAKVALIAQSLFAGGWPTWVAFLGVCAFSLFILLAATDLFAGFANKLTAQFASLVSSMAAATAALWGAYRFVRPMFDGVAAFAKDLATEKKLRADNLTKAQTELATVQAELNTAREKADGAKKELLPYRKFDKGRGHGTILRYFLFEDSDTKEYEKHIGLVSRARRTFQKLDEIIRAQRLRPQNRPKRAVPDRIVLYIDDLDRCRNEQVVRVLEAVHLLLAFESIVVVVGVDARWIRAALAKYYQGEFTVDQEKKGNGKDTSGSPPTTPEDYLQKIFQIPFWLQPFALDPAHAYAKFVTALASRNTPAGKASQGAGGTDKDKDAVHWNADSGSQAQASAAIAEAVATATERVTLSDTEIAVLSALAPLAGGTPRAIKRFVNLYRLIRARQRGGDFDKFVGQAGEDASYPGIAFLLALETGQPPEIIEVAHQILSVNAEGSLFAAVRKMKGGVETALDKAKSTAEDLVNKPSSEAAYAAANEHLRNLQDKLAVMSKIEASLAQLKMPDEIASLNPANVSVARLRKALHDVRRYSFHHHS